MNQKEKRKEKMITIKHHVEPSIRNSISALRGLHNNSSSINSMDSTFPAYEPESEIVLQPKLLKEPSLVSIMMPSKVVKAST